MTPTEEWKRHWTVSLAAFAGISISVSHLYSFGVFIPSLEKEFGWSRTQISGGLTALSTLSVLVAPFMGAVIDRLGSRRVAVPGVVLYCIALASVAAAGPSIYSWYAVWLFVACGSLCLKPTVWVAAISSHFDRGRGLAIALALCGTGLGSALFPLAAATMMPRLGWRGSYIGLAVLDLLIALPLVIIFFRDAQDALGRGGAKRAASTDRPGSALKPALRSGRFAKLVVISLAFSVGTTSLIIHFVPIMTERGLPLTQAAAVAGVIGVSSVIGRLATGYLLDRYSGPKIGVLSLTLPLLVCASLWGGPAWMPMIAIAFLLGFSLGAEIDVVAYLASRYFGLRHFGVIFGTMAGVQSLGAGLGPLLAGYVHDTTGSYSVLPLAIMPLFAISAALVATLGSYPLWLSPDEDEQQSKSLLPPADR